MRAAFGDAGGRLIAAGIAISTLGFLSQSMLTAPRVYYAMARDGLFFPAVGRLGEKTRAPFVAIALQGAMAVVIALSGRYEQILSYVVSVDWIFFSLAAVALLVLRRRDTAGTPPGARMPGHPWTTGAFVLVCVTVVAGTVAAAPVQSAIGFALLLAGVPAYLYWASRRATA